MNGSPQFDRLLEIFEAALDRPPEQWTAFLESRCDGDSALRHEVARMLARHRQAFAFFDDLGADLRRAGPEELDLGQSVEGRRIGSYRVVREIGRGGMGAVYLAERDDGQFQQQVAIKVIRPGRQSEAVLRRFLAERRILSQLNHPGIARLLDGGATQEGLPYFVLEYVDGLPLLDDCDRQCLPVKERLRLFISVAAAVEHAHRNLVVHRDLKPGNILVSSQGEIKLLDFGIAKPLAGERPIAGEDTGADAGDTLTGHRVLTPQYAAPEQWLGKPVTTATDVYGLGGVLYELLSGERPVPKAGSWEDLERAVLHQDPEPVSTAARRSIEQNAKRRGVSPTTLCRLLSGDLDTICAKALHKDPDRRYSSAADLGDDIRRHLDGLPVLARPDSRGYRARKFVSRHKWGVATAVAAVLAAAVFSSALAIQSVRLTAERDKARQVSELFVDLFTVSDPDLGTGAQITAREFLDRGAAKIQTGLAGQPDIKAGLMDVMARVYHKLGLYPPARRLYESSLALRRSVATSPGLDLAANLHRLGLVLHDQGNYNESARRFQEALDVRRRVLGLAHPDTAATQTYLGLAHFRKGDYDAAQPLFEGAVSVLRRARTAPDPHLADALTGLAMLHYAQGRFAEAEPLLRESLQLRRQLFGPSHQQLADTLNNLASVLSRMGKASESEPLQREAIAILRKVRPGHPKLATAVNNLGLVLMARGDFDRAEPLLREGISIRRDRLDGQHPDLAQSLNNLGVLLQNTGRLEEAEAAQREALRIVRKNFPGDHVAVMRGLGNLGSVLHSMRRSAQSERLLAESLAMSRRLFGDAHPLVATNLNNLASLLHDGKRPGAETAYREALAIRRKALPAGHPHIAYALVGLGQWLLENGDPMQAEPLLREALEIRRKTFSGGAAEIGEAESALGACLFALKRHAEAGPLLTSGLEKLRARHGPGHRLTRKAASRLARASARNL
ncbi:MAG: serine/threonine-protein kinase [Bryobacteraceae bacterium]